MHWLRVHAPKWAKDEYVKLLRLPERATKERPKSILKLHYLIQRRALLKSQRAFFSRKNFKKIPEYQYIRLCQLTERFIRKGTKIIQNTEWKVSVFGDCLFFFSVFSPHAENYGPEKLRILKSFTQWKLPYLTQKQVLIKNQIALFNRE